METVRNKFRALRPVMDERMTRLWAGVEADAIGDGGIAIVEGATGMSRTTIRAGRDELRKGVDPSDVVNARRSGGGRPAIEVTHPELVPTLESLVDPVTRGDPESPLRWTSRSTQAGGGARCTWQQGQPAEGRAAAPRQWLQLARDTEDAGGLGAPR